MQVRIELNQAREILWSLPNTNHILSIQNPAFNVDLDKLPFELVYAIYQGITTKKILSDTSVDDIYKKYIEKRIVHDASQPKPEKRKEEKHPLLVQAEEHAKAISEKAELLLKSGVTELKKEISEISDMHLIKRMIELEDLNGKRSTVSKMLTDRLKKWEKQVSNQLKKRDPVKLTDPTAVDLGNGKTVSLKEDVIEFEESIEVKIDPKTGRILNAPEDEMVVIDEPYNSPTVNQDVE